MELVAALPPPDPGNHLATIAFLRDMADKLERGEMLKIDFGCVVAFDVGGGLLTSAMGGDSDYFRLIGLLELSKQRLSDLLMGA